MARHLLRDYLTQNFATSSSTFIGGYLLSIYLRRVLLYTYVGDTNYPINDPTAPGTLLISTADSTPTAASPTFAVGTRASINQSGSNITNVGKEFYVGIPSGTRTVSQADVGRIITLQSTANPSYNSGCFVIDGYDTTTNSYLIDYRSGTTLNGNTNIASGSNNVSLPQTTINVLSTTGFTSSGTISVTTTNGQQTVSYTGTSGGTQFTGCSGGTGTMNTGNLVVQQITLPQTTINVPSTSNFSSSGTLFVYSSTGRQTVTYTSITATSFTGASGGTGNVLGYGAYPIVQAFTTTIAAGSNGSNLPQGTINVASVGTFTTVASGSNGTYLPQGTINLTSTTGFPTSGTAYITTGNGVQAVTYTGASGGTLTGCTGGTGIMTTGNTAYVGFPPSGQIFVATNTTVQMVSYTGVTSTTFTGCTGGTGTLSTNNVVYYSPSVPPIELSDSMNWYLYEKDALCPVQGANNTNTSSQYRGNGNSTTPRIILQSPSSIGWQIRICNETSSDTSECSVVTTMPGLGGNSSGDFAVGGPHTHGPLFYNSSSTNYQGTAIGMGDNLNLPSGTSSIPYRITIVGDDTGTGVVMIGRRPTDALTPNSYFIAFGQPENEPTPLPPNNEARLYVIASFSGTHGNDLNDISWWPGNIGTTPSAQGMGHQSYAITGQNAVPTSMTVCLNTYVTGASQFGGPSFDNSATDSPWLGGTELLNVDLLSGSLYSWLGTSGTPVMPFECRFIGTIPHIREGRANFSEYTVTTDVNRAFQHTRRGIFIFWGGPQVVA
jgi:hypothetical protein